MRGWAGYIQSNFTTKTKKNTVSKLPCQITILVHDIFSIRKKLAPHDQMKQAELIKGLAKRSCMSAVAGGTKEWKTSIIYWIKSPHKFHSSFICKTGPRRYVVYAARFVSLWQIVLRTKQKIVF